MEIGKIIGGILLFLSILVQLPSPTLGCRRYYSYDEYQDIISFRATPSIAAKLYQKIIEGQSGNVIISPISIQISLSLAMFGASGATKAEMVRGLEYSFYSTETIARNFEAFTEIVKKTNGLSIANKVYVRNKFSIKKSFQDIAAKSFNTEAQSVDFSDKTNAAETINGWVEEKTNNKIKNFITADSLDADTRMVLVNAIYFKGSWVYEFDKTKTFKGPFYVNDQDTVEVDFMKILEKFNYGHFPELNASAIELPYKGSDISMVIICPDSKTGLAYLESKLHTFDMLGLSLKMKEQLVDFELPKFKIDFGIELNDPLKKMGMRRMFSNAAKFDNLLEQSKPLKVSKVVHKASIEVNEEGAEASAATGQYFIPMCSICGPKYFRADRGFIFIIKSKTEILFIGRQIKAD